MRAGTFVLAAVVSALPLAGCGVSEERATADRAEFERLLAAYAEALTASYAAGDAGPLAEVATERERVRVERRIEELAQEGHGLRPELVRSVVEEIDRYSNTSATVTTRETWNLRLVDLASEATVGESEAQENRVAYTFLRERDRWWIAARLLQSSSAAP